MEQLEPILRLLAAVALGALVGWDREHHGKPAGARTHMLISLGSAAFTLGPFAIEDDLEATSRVIQGVAGGMGLLAAGSIIQSKAQVSGITTAVSVWVCGAIGAACGLGNFVVATGTALAAVLVLLIARFQGESSTPDAASGGDAERASASRISAPSAPRGERQSTG